MSEFEDDNIRALKTTNLFKRNNSINVIPQASNSMEFDFKAELTKRKYSLITMVEKHNEMLIKISKKLDQLEREKNKKKCVVM